MATATKKKIAKKAPSKAPAVKRGAATVTDALTPPALGKWWPGQGGEFRGTVLGIDGGRNYHLIVGPGLDGRLNHKDLLAWVKKLSVEGHKDFDIPIRREGRFLQCNAKDLFGDATYWLKEQYQGGSDFAWIQNFDDGYQFTAYKGNEFAGRAVRRIYI